MRKKLITLSLMLATVFCLTACGKKEQPAKQTSANEVPQQTQINEDKADTKDEADNTLNKTTLVVGNDSTNEAYSGDNGASNNNTSENSTTDPNTEESATTEEQNSEETKENKIALSNGVGINLPANSEIIDERNDNSENKRYTIKIKDVEYMICTTSTPTDRNSRLQEKLQRTLDAPDGVFDVYTSGEFNDVTEMNEKFTTVEVYKPTSIGSQIHIMRQDYNDNEATDDCYECGPVYFAVVKDVKTPDDTGAECMMTIRAITDDESTFIAIVKKMIP